MPQSSIFPIFLRAEYRDDGQGFARFQSDAQRAAQAAKREFASVGAALNAALTAPRTGGGSLDLGTGQLREQIRAQEQAAIAAREVANATRAAAIANGELRNGLTPTVRAYFDLARSKEADVASSRAQLVALEAVQAQLNLTASATTALTGENLRLAQAEAGAANGASLLTAIYRGTAAELGRVSNSARESASAFELLFQAQDARASSAAQAFFNTAAGLDRQTKSARDSASAFEDLFAAQNLAQVAARQITADYLALAQAEAAAVNGAALITATLRGTALEQGRVATSARDSARAFEEAFAAQEAAANAAAAAQQRLAASAAQLRGELDPMFVAQQRFDQELARADALLEAGTISTREYAAAQQLARDNLRQAAQAAVATADATQRVARVGTTAAQSVINSQRASRTAFIQLGQQMQDVAVQAQLGTNAFIIFGQQVPQAAFALSGLADSANKTQAAIGRFATFLSGPYGAAVFVAIAVLGPFIQKLFESGEAADASGRAQRSLAEVLLDTKSSYEEVTKALDDYNRAQARAQEVTLQTIQLEAESIAQNLRKAITIRELIKANLDLYAAEVRRGPTGPNGQGQIGAAIVASGLSSELAAQDAQIARLTQGAATVRVRAATEIARINSDSTAKISAGFDLLRSEARRTITDVNALAERLTQLNRNEASALEAERASNRRTRTPRERVNREPEQLAKLADDTAERVARINERFDEQPRLIDAAAQASRQLNDVIADINKRMATAKNLTAEQRAEFEAIKTAAADAQDTIGDALLRPFQQLREESDQRLEIEQLLAQGRTAEAAAMQDIIRLEQQLGTEVSLRAQVERLIADGQTEQAQALQAFIAAYAELKDEVRARAEDEERLTQIYRDQAAIFQAQLDVVSTVRRDLTDLLSGRSADFFGNFRQALRDLQGQRLFEDLFGDSFRAIEEELRAQTPQGRANARFTAEVEKAATSTDAVATALDGLAEAVVGATQRIASGVTGAANDNAAGPEIVVTGNRGTETDISRRSTKEIADRIAEATVQGFIGPLEDVLGPQLFAGLSSVLTGALSGFVRGGEAGAVFGGLQGLSELVGGSGGLTRALGRGVEGSARGTQVQGLLDALGVQGSTSGSQIGGSIGGLTGIPGADVVGSLVGGSPNLGTGIASGLGAVGGFLLGGPIGAVIGATLGRIVGSLLSGTPRGSATIGGSGGSLGVTGTVGNSGSRREASGGLAGSVIEAVNAIAEQLGAGVNASSGRVSIGLRGDNIRVDPRGGGATRIDNGAIDFGDDAEAAVAFAVRNLIQDGVITGLRASEQRLLRAGDDIEAALQDVLTFRSVFDRLEAIRDPLGGAIRSLNSEFTELIELFTRAGASTEEFADLEELYNLERARAIEEASDRVVGSLRQLLNDLTIGDSGLSLRSRRANALGEFNDLAGRVAAGDTTAFDDFADISQQLLDIERQLFGSTQSYFDRLAQITALTETAIADQTNVTSIGAAAPSPFDERNGIARSIESASAEQVGILRAINDNLIALGSVGLSRTAPVFSGFGSNVLNQAIANF